MSGWADCLNELRIQHHKEPRHRYAENENRPDIAVYDSTRGTSYDLDVSMAHPWSQDAICKAAIKQDWAAELRQMRKRTKYEKQTMSTGEKCEKVVPLVFEHFGLWGEEAYDYLKELAKGSRDSKGRKNVADFLTRWRRQLAIKIQRCNARVILNKLRKFTCRLAEDTLFEDVQRCLH